MLIIGILLLGAGIGLRVWNSRRAYYGTDRPAQDLSYSGAIATNALNKMLRWITVGSVILGVLCIIGSFAPTRNF
jgi:hypothetical protein